jgi:hypothetical protein
MTLTAEPEALVITEPGIYDMPEDAYHADPVPGGSLSASGAKKLLSCPARFDYDRRHPPTPSQAMELGTAVHTLVLGRGARITVVDADSWRTKAAKEQADEARAESKVPLLAADFQHAKAAADAVRAHPLAGALFNPEHGDPERSIFWTDDLTGVWLRSRLDWLPRSPGHGRRILVTDFKTCASASKSSIARAVANFGYHVQDAFYTAAVQAMGLDDDPAFLFVFAETVPPYLITVAQLDDDAKAAGQARMRRAIERFRDCTRDRLWPAYSDRITDIETISLPRWAQAEEE